MCVRLAGAYMRGVVTLTAGSALPDIPRLRMTTSLSIHPKVQKGNPGGLGGPRLLKVNFYA